MKRITRLKAEAKDVAEWREHRMTRFHHYTPDNAVSECIICGAEVQVLANPAPNQIDIGGEAIALSCLN